jgi:hypothetical protein
VRRIKCFADAEARVSSYATFDAGPRVIEVSRIVGTVNKCHELDGRFRTRRRRDRKERWRRGRLAGANLAFTSLPPIDVYLLEGEYYVIDGNRRVAAALEQGLEFMDAQVTECVPHLNTEALRGTVSRRRFEAETGLKSIRLDHESGYSLLLEEAGAYEGGSAEDLPERAARWHSEVYLPACAAVRESDLGKSYPGWREGDLFVLVVRFYRQRLGSVPRGVGFAALISGFLFARCRKRRRLWRVLPFRALYWLLKGSAARRDESKGEH